MELSFSELRAKEVVNTQDGKRLGKACDVALCYPENKWLGIVVPGGRGWGSKKNNLFIDLRHIVKIGEDVILVNIGAPRKNCEKGNPCPPPPKGFEGGRNFEEYE
jgi:YlmC/YmxH family sporulation protein